jgi:hypothetical protein
VLKLYAMTFEFAFRLLFGSKSWAGARLPGFGVDFSYETLGKLQPELESGTGIEAHHMPGRLVGDVPDEDAIPVHFKTTAIAVSEPCGAMFLVIGVDRRKNLNHRVRRRIFYRKSPWVGEEGGHERLVSLS